MAIKKGDFWINKKGDEVHVDLISVDDQLKDDLVEKLIIKSIEVQERLIEFKAYAFEEVETFYNLLLEKYKINIKEHSKKGNLTIENYSGTAKIQIAVAERIAFDEKLKIAKAKIDEYLHEVTKDSSADVRTLITKAFEVDKKGDVNAKKILALKSYGIKHQKWIDAMNIIDEATEIVSSKNYIRFYTRKTTEEPYKQVSLDIAGV